MITKIIRKEDGLMVNQDDLPMIIQEATRFSSKIYCINAGAKANTKSLLSMMSFISGVTDSIEVTAEGTDEEDAIKAMSAILCK